MKRCLLSLPVLSSCVVGLDDLGLNDLGLGLNDLGLGLDDLGFDDLLGLDDSIGFG